MKKATGVDTSEFAKNTDLTSLKSDADKLLDVDKLKKQNKMLLKRLHMVNWLKQLLSLLLMLFISLN